MLAAGPAGGGGAGWAQQPGCGLALLELAFQLAGADPQPGQLKVPAGGQGDPQQPGALVVAGGVLAQPAGQASVLGEVVVAGVAVGGEQVDQVDELDCPTTDTLIPTESSTTRHLRRLHVTRLRDRWLRRTARPVGHIHRLCYRN